MNQWEWNLLEDHHPVEAISVAGGELRTGDRVVLRPRRNGDVLDLALAGKCAVVESIEQDYESRIHLGVVLEDDPGMDLGLLRQPGHRFFFTPEEVEFAGRGAAVKQPRILVAGIGNIFLGDDAFGVEVIRRLAGHTFPASVSVRDFGIRGYDLAYALLDGYDLAVLVDAAPRGEPAGTLYVIEADLSETDAPAAAPDAHTMNPVNVLRMAQSMGPVSNKILLVACEPATLGGEEGHMGLSEPVSDAIDGAVKLVQDIVGRFLEDSRVAA